MCWKFNYVTRACKSKCSTPNKTGHKHVQTVEKEDVDLNSDLFMDTDTAEVEDDDDDDDDAYADIKLGPQKAKLTLKLHAGAQTRMIPAKAFDELKPCSSLLKVKRKVLGL